MMQQTIQHNIHSQQRCIIMARRTKSGKHQLNLYDELKDILDEYSEELYANKEEALDAAADFLVDQLEANSPVRTGKLKESWLRTDKYTGVRYVGNSSVGSNNKYGYGIPLTNLLEFGKKGHPFIRKTFEQNKERIIDIIKGGLENYGNSK